MTVTYLLSYANGPVRNVNAVYRLNDQGIGYWMVGEDFIVQPRS